MNRGSEWRKWDLHVHSPASHGFSGTWDQFEEQLKNADCEVIGINDYFSVDGYKRIKERIEAGDLNIGNKKILPVVEFRMRDVLKNRHTGRSGININFHIIFDNSIPVLKVETFIKSLEIEGAQIADRYTDAKFLRETAKVYFKKDVIDKLESNPDFQEKFIVLLPYDEYSGIGDIDPGTDDWIKKGFIKKSHVLGSSNKKQIDFFLWQSPLDKHGKEKFTQEQFAEWFIVKKPCIKGSDSHEHTYPIGKLKDADSNPTEKYCWIKADTSFEGLKQIIYEPEERVYIGDDDPRKFNYTVVDTFRIIDSNDFFYKDSPHVFLNPGLNCIIGSRGAGKSVLLDAISFSLGDKRVVEKERNNYIGYFFEKNKADIVESSVKNSYAGEVKKISPISAVESGFVFDYYHQKRIGYLADPVNEEELSQFLFEKIFKMEMGTSVLFAELDEQCGQYISELAINREKVNACEEEISKEEEINKKIKEESQRVEFLSKPFIKGLLEERNKVIKIQEKFKNIKERIENVEENPLVMKDDLLDTAFFKDMYLSNIDPEGTVLPRGWKPLEFEVSALMSSSTQNKKKLMEAIVKLIEKVIKIEIDFKFSINLEKIHADIQKESQKYDITITTEELGKLDLLQKEIVKLEGQIKAIHNKKEQKKTLLEERKKLITNYDKYLVSAKDSLELSFKKFLEGNGAILNQTVDIDIGTKISLNAYLETIEKKAKHDSERRFPNRRALLEIFARLGCEKIISSFRKDKFDDWIGEDFGHASIFYFKDIKNKEEIAMYLEELLPGLTVHLLWRPNTDRNFKDIKKCSIGERGTALTSIILVTGNEPLIIDQLEDDLDHFYLYKTLVPIIKKVKRKRQLIFATHDANIVVNGDTELILIVSTEDGKHGTITPATIEDYTNRQKLMDILEGSKDAFQARGKRYFGK